MGFGRPAVLASAVILVVLSVLFARIRHPWLAPLTRPTRAAVAGSLRADWAIWLVAAVVATLVGFVLFANGWRAGRRRLGLRRLGLERPAGPRRDRVEHLGRQLPARGAVLRRRAADLPLVRRLPRGDRVERGGVDLIPVYFATSALFAGVMALVDLGPRRRG